MTLRDLSKPQSDAAHAAARILLSCSPNRAADREAYALAAAALCILLPEDVDACEIVREAARWQMRDAVAEAVAA